MQRIIIAWKWHCQILSYADANDLVAFQQTCRRYQNLSKSNDLWREVCRRRWQAWPYSALISNSEEDTDLFRALAIDEEWGNWTWKERYQWAQGDLRRTEITMYEMEGLKWDRTFVRRDSNSVVYFYQGRMCETDRVNPLFRNCQLRMVDEDESEVHHYFRQEVEAAFEELLRQSCRRPVMIAGGASISRSSLKQYLHVNANTQFPAYYIGRTSVGNWLLWSFKNEVLFSVGISRGEEIPEQLQALLDSNLAEVF